MSNPNVPSAELSALEALEERLLKGREFIERAQMPLGQIKMWTGSVRGRLRALFGEHSAVYAAWPTADTPIPADAFRETLIERVDLLERIVRSISDGAIKAAARASVGRVFIGHGRSPLWRELKDFLQERLALSCDEFNRESVAGVAVTERLNIMLDDAVFAFLIMTAENEHADSTLHARENVVHEVGLFQGRLGLRRAIVLVEEGCQTFSNIHGLTYIGFPPGRIGACFEDIRWVLEREGISAG